MKTTFLKVLFSSLFCIITIGIVGLFFQFGTNIRYDNVPELTAYLQNRTNLFVCDGTLEQEYFWKFSQHITTNMLPDLRYRIRYGIITLFLLSPILLILGYLWKQAILKAPNKTVKIKYILFLLTNLTFLPAFAFLTDWGRWFGAFFTVNLFFIFLLAARQDSCMLLALKELGTHVQKYPIIYICLLLYLSSFEKFEGINYLEQAENFYHAVYGIKTFLLNLF